MPSILIVDDDDTVRTALERWFVRRGFDVQTAADGVEAVASCASTRYDAVTIDLDMPRMDGLTAIHHIRTQHPTLPIIVVTGFASEAVYTGASGVTAVLLKPLRPSEVEAEVLRFLH
jgi:CheY-like chemotaxis protein